MLSLICPQTTASTATPAKGDDELVETQLDNEDDWCDLGGTSEPEDSAVFD